MPAFLLPLLGVFGAPVADGLGYIFKYFFGGKGEPQTVDDVVKLQKGEIDYVKARAELTRAESTSEGWVALATMIPGTHAIVQNLIALLAAVSIFIKETTRPVMAWGVIFGAYYASAMKWDSAPTILELAFTAFGYYLGDRGYRYIKAQGQKIK